MSFSYDNANRITTLLQGSALTTYQYDATGNETGTNLNGALTTNVFDNENRRINIQFPSGSPGFIRSMVECTGGASA